MSNEFKIVCATCEAVPEIVADPDGEVAMCPICGQRDDAEDAQRRLASIS